MTQSYPMYAQLPTAGSSENTHTSGNFPFFTDPFLHFYKDGDKEVQGNVPQNKCTPPFIPFELYNLQVINVYFFFLVVLNNAISD